MLAGRYAHSFNLTSTLCLAQDQMGAEVSHWAGRSHEAEILLRTGFLFGARLSGVENELEGLENEAVDARQDKSS